MIEAPPRERTNPSTTEKFDARFEVRGMVSGGPSRGVYARFLELPPALVLAVLWLTGVVLLALCGLTLYLAGSALA
jgi:hypothetical protein